MYGPSLPFSQDLFVEKYCEPGESVEGSISRVSRGLCDDAHHETLLMDIFGNQRFLPGGRIQSSIGSRKQTTAYNCFVSGTIDDSFVDGSGSIMSRLHEASRTMRMGGGMGYGFSTLRPAKALIRKLDSHSSGPISFMKIYDANGLCCSSAGHRRGAQMGVLRVDHPDIEAFIRAKQPPPEAKALEEILDKTDPADPAWLGLYNALQATLQLKGFNISVALTDAFMRRVEEGDASPFPLVFGGETYRTVNPLALWETLMESTWSWAEPGALFIDRINRMNNLRYCERIVATNPCVPGDTPILTLYGYAPIQNCVGKPTVIWNGDEWSSVTPFSTGTNRLFAVTLSNGTVLRCTGNHEFVLQGGKRCEAAQLAAGSRLERFKMPVIAVGEHYAGDAYSQGFYSGDGSQGLAKSFLYRPKYVCIPRLHGTVGAELKSGKARMWYHGPMKAKDFVPINGSLSYRLEWLAGLIDSDGTAVPSVTGEGVQISSVDKKFLDGVRLLLTSLGVSARVALNRPATEKEFNGKLLKCQACYSLQITPSDVASLVESGLRTERVRLSGGKPQRRSAHHVFVVSVEDTGESEETFCFTEPKAHRGTFNGIVTGQCGEQPLPPHAACLLGSYNLVKYLVASRSLAEHRQPYEFNWSQLLADIAPVVRAMDNVVDRTRYPLREQEAEAQNKRRMGIGVTGLANCLEAMGHPYGSATFVYMQEKILGTINDACYNASVDLAIEKGAFPMFDATAYCQSEFLNSSLGQDTIDRIRRHGIRNSHLTSIAPTGTISMAADNVSSSIEPVFAYENKRLVNRATGQKEYSIPDYGYAQLGVRGRRCRDVTIDEHLAVLTMASKYVDSAVSKTCNVPSSTPWADFKNVYLRAWKGGAKGVTTYQVGGRRAGILKSGDADVPESKPVEACAVDPATGRRSCE